MTTIPARKNYTSKFVPSILTTTTSTPDDDMSTDDDTRSIIIGASVGGFILLVVFILVGLYCWKKRKVRNDKRTSDAFQSTKATNTENSTIVLSSPNGFVYDNRALQASQDIDIEVGRLKEERNSLIVEHDGNSKPLPLLNSFDETLHDMSIKLMTPWVPVYAEEDSNDFQVMKKLVEDSIEALYIDFCDFRGVTVQRFRQGSVIADVRMKFSLDVIDPLRMLQKAVRSGKFAQLEVDKTFFELRTSIDVHINNQEPVMRPSRGVSGSLTRSQRMESGYYGSQYGSQNFEPETFLEHTKARETSQRSTTSIESNTSDFGTSHSVSPKSSSSTNISIHSQVEDEPKKERRLLQGLSRKLRDKSKHEQRMAIPHIALFNFSPQDHRELALRQNELITVTVVDNGGWVKAVNREGKQGWVPQNFVAPFDPMQLAATKKTVESLMYFDGVLDSINVVVVDETNKISSDGDENKQKNDDCDPSSVDGCSISGLFVTIFPNIPTAKKELALEIGDLVDVLKTSETGWWKGCSLRTNDVGWFPSSYVKPHTADFDISEYLEEGSEEEDKGTVSDSEVHMRSLSFHKRKKNEEHEVQEGYSSDDGISRKRTNTKYSKQSKANECVPVGCSIKAHSGYVLIDITCTTGDSFSAEGKSSDESIESHQQKIDFPEDHTGVIRRSSPKFKREDISQHRVSFVDDTEIEYIHAVDPPCKPVPPKPREIHLKHTYQNLILSGKLGSTESLKTRSTECLASYSQIRSTQDRRNSEEISIDGLYKPRANSKPIDRMRPHSFQENPKASFFYLANRYASSMKAAWSFPSLVGDQVNLSPDDERPYLVPIPRKSRRKGNAKIVKSIDTSSLPQTKNDTTHETRKFSPNKPPTKPVRRSSSGSIVTHTVCVNIPTDPDTEVTCEIQPVPRVKEVDVFRDTEKTEITVSQIKPVIAPKPSFLLADKTHSKHPVVSPKPPPAPKRSSSKNITQKFMEDLLRNNESTSVPRTSESHARHSNRLSRNLNQLHLASFSPINEEAEQSNMSPDGNENHLHRRYHSEPHDGSFNLHTKIAIKEYLQYNATTSEHIGEGTPPGSPLSVGNRIEIELNSEELPLRALSPAMSEKNETTDQFRAILNEKMLRKHDKLNELSSNSRTSSMQSLNSLASSRSTASSKHEQLNLRKAIMDVYGQGTNDLSFKAGSILYELRPRNKEGYSYGLLEDSTQGFYPSKAVQTFQES